MMNKKIKSAKEHGAEDAETWYTENSGPAEVCSYTDEDVLADVAAMRAGRRLMPDEAVINAMGRRWVLEQAGAVDTSSDEEWATVGLPWCCTYNEAYLARLEELAKESV